MPSAQTIRFTVVQSQTSSTTSLRFDLLLLSSTHIAHAITALAKRDSNTHKQREHLEKYALTQCNLPSGRDFFTGLQKHVSVTTGVVLCSLMFSGTLCRSSPHV